MQAQRQAYVTAQEYLDLERLAPAKSEYYAGEIFAMAGASPRHKVEFDADPVPSVLRRVKEPEAEYAEAQRRPGMP